MFDSFMPEGETKVLAGSKAHPAVPAPLKNMRGLPQSQPEQPVLSPLSILPWPS